MSDDRIPPEFRRELLASLDRLVEAGLLEGYSFDPATDGGSARPASS